MIRIARYQDHHKGRRVKSGDPLNPIPMSDGSFGFYVGRPTPLGNPYRVGKFYTLEDSLNLYDVWLDEQLYDRHSPAYKMFHRLLAQLKVGKGLTLMCWCIDGEVGGELRCHAQIIGMELLKQLEAI